MVTTISKNLITVTHVQLIIVSVQANNACYANMNDNSKNTRLLAKLKTQNKNQHTNIIYEMQVKNQVNK